MYVFNLSKRKLPEYIICNAYVTQVVNRGPISSSQPWDSQVDGKNSVYPTTHATCHGRTVRFSPTSFRFNHSKINSSQTQPSSGNHTSQSVLGTFPKVSAQQETDGRAMSRYLRNLICGGALALRGRKI